MKLFLTVTKVLIVSGIAIVKSGITSNDVARESEVINLTTKNSSANLDTKNSSCTNFVSYPLIIDGAVGAMFGGKNLVDEDPTSTV